MPKKYTTEIGLNPIPWCECQRLIWQNVESLTDKGLLIDCIKLKMILETLQMGKRLSDDYYFIKNAGKSSVLKEPELYSALIFMEREYNKEIQKRFGLPAKLILNHKAYLYLQDNKRRIRDLTNFLNTPMT